MTSLDPRSMAAAAAFALIFQALTMIYVARLQLRDRSVNDLAIGATLGAVGAILGFARPHLSPIITHWAASVVLIAAHAFGVRAFGRWVGRPVSGRLLVALVMAASLIIAFFLFVAPRYGIRIATYSLAVAVNSLAIAAFLLDVPRGPLRVTHWPIGIVHLLHGCFAIGRAFLALIETSREDVFEPSLIQSLWFLQSLIVSNLTFTGMVLMITQRISIELEREKASRRPLDDDG
jgi:hypothetical protein